MKGPEQGWGRSPNSRVFVSDLKIWRSLEAVASKLFVEICVKSPQPQVSLWSGQNYNPSSIYTICAAFCAFLGLKELLLEAWKRLPKHKKLLKRDSQREIKCSDSNCLFCCGCFFNKNWWFVPYDKKFADPKYLTNQCFLCCAAKELSTQTVADKFTFDFKHDLIVYCTLVVDEKNISVPRAQCLTF